MANKQLNRKKINPSVPIFTGKRIEEEISIQLYKYNSEECIENSNYSEFELTNFKEYNYQFWLNIHGIHDAERVRKLCKKLGIHDLTIQDILDVNQRPKFQEYEDYWFFTLKSVIPSENSSIEEEQLSFILGKNYLISFQERKADYFNHIRERLRSNIGIIRSRGIDMLLYLLLEAILDNYFKTVSEIENNIEKEGVIDMEKDPSPKIINSIERYKRQIHQIKKNGYPD